MYNRNTMTELQISNLLMGHYSRDLFYVLVDSLVIIKYVRIDSLVINRYVRVDSRVIMSRYTSNLITRYQFLKTMCYTLLLNFF